MVSLINAANSLGLVTKLVRHVFPLVDIELEKWRLYAAEHCCPELAEQALASIENKKFHCQGGSIYSLYNGVNTTSCVRLIVALQTVSDYLDNLCDRAGITDEAAFRQLHLAIYDALEPTAPLHNYYTYYPFKNDGGYLSALVTTCRTEISCLPAYDLVKPFVLHLAKLYSDLQTYKHLDPTIRAPKMFAWATASLEAYPDLAAQEFAAAAGSTLGIFMLCALAATPSLTEATVKQTYTAYFPWISGLHILLDYFIDLREDQENGDLNFITYYQTQAEIQVRLTHFLQQALLNAQNLPDPIFNKTIVRGLLAMYLSDPKTSYSPEKEIKTALLSTGGNYTKFMYALCRLLRQRQLL
ncbi:MAG: hypothetical protein H6Q73_1984 [Firmicutes bacterium]|nr:hypothetical protein [Bacillota bacterium]